MSGYHTINGCGGPVYTVPITFQVPDLRFLTGEEQKQVCMIAVNSASQQLGLDPDNTRCYIANQSVAPSNVVEGFYDVSGIAILNFDDSILPESLSVEKINSVAKAAAATASDFVIAGAIPQTEAPSAMPSLSPSISSQPSLAPSISLLPTETLTPTRHPVTASPVIAGIDGDFASKDIGYVGYAGSAYQPGVGTWIVRGSGADIWVRFYLNFLLILKFKPSVSLSFIKRSDFVTT